jgi:hypothetical protein
MEKVVEFNIQAMFSQFMCDNFAIFVVAIAFILLDIASGIIVAILQRNFSSTIMRKGLGHKLGYVFVMCAVAILQVGMMEPSFHVEFDFPLFNVVCAFVIFMEFMSVMENACLLNPQLNNLVGKFLAQNNYGDTEEVDE